MNVKIAALLLAGTVMASNSGGSLEAGNSSSAGAAVGQAGDTSGAGAAEQAPGQTLDSGTINVIRLREMPGGISNDTSAAPDATPSAPDAAPAGGDAAADEERCEQELQRYRESQECFAPYRNANGSIKPEAFEHCEDLPQPQCPNQRAHE